MNFEAFRLKFLAANRRNIVVAHERLGKKFAQHTFSAPLKNYLLSRHWHMASV